MILGVVKEILEGERRVAALPEEVRKYRDMGFEVLVEAGAGAGVFRRDEEYVEAGAEVVADAEELWNRADVVIKVKQPVFNDKTGKHEAEMIRSGATLITFLHPAAPDNHEMIKKLRDRNIVSFTMDGIPRISRAQRMDALTSMSTITGYKAVLMAASAFPRFIPLVASAIGTIMPAKALIVGVGVVGLQAIATARRLGATVKAVDIREEARLAGDSLGAKIAGFDVPAELAMGPGGYAKALPSEWLQKERESLLPLVTEADIVILSALVPGELAPVLVTEDMVRSMRPGSVIVDVSIDQGGNCELTRAGEQVTAHDVLVSGIANIPGSVPVDATWMYAQNMYEYVANLFKKGLGEPDWADELVSLSLVTRDGKIWHAGALEAMGL
ncbi:MAG: NAD(P) transhydrogenase subunit alpha part 1 [Actinobacteria bacterium ADurb.Bin444]|nr:MAG: NAD(P) transhydrogenase subunit alpha part 1 [Actinobacteria bacterium ADurb.Bin444]